MATTTPPHYAMYLRQSLAADGSEIKVSTQRKDLTERLLPLGATWDEFVDNDVSATSHMPGSKKKAKPRGGNYYGMIRLIETGKSRTPGKKYAGIAVSKSDRLYREPRQLEDLIDLVDGQALEIFTVSGGIFDLSTPEGRAMARMLCVMARMEMEQKSVRHRRENRRMAEEDARPWWPSRPFGYDAPPDPVSGKWWTVRRDHSKKIIAVNKIRKHPTEAKLLKDAYRRFNAGTRVRSIATGWNKEGITTPRGNQWTGTGVRQLLLAARNAGLREYHGKVVGKGTWEKQKIVTREVWEQAVRRLADPTRATNTSRGRKYLLSGIARCGREGCGAGLGSAISSRGQRQYHCNHCQKLSRDGIKLDAVVIERVVWRLSREDAVDLLRPPVEEVDAESLREERRALEDKLIQLGKDFANEDPAFIRSALAEINGRLAEIGTALDDPGKAAIFEDVIGAKDVRKAFMGLDLGRQRTIIDALMTITVNPVGKGVGARFDAKAIDMPLREDL
jgi:site-specific DNA recombinase